MVTKEESLPAKSRNYLYAQSIFFVQFNDVDFYVEDENSESLYYTIFSRLFPDIRIERIFPLGGKLAVLEHAQAQQDMNSIYILDKDFDDLLAVQLDRPNVFYLDRFCIENYVLEPSAVAQFIVSERPKLTVAKVQKAFDIQGFIESSIVALRLLFLYFFLVQKYGVTLRNTSSPIARFTRKNQPWLVDGDSIAAYRGMLQRQAAAQKVEMELSNDLRGYSVAFELRKKRLVGHNVSGKYLLALMLRRIRTVFAVPDTELESATFRLADYCTFSSLVNFQDRVSRVVASGKRPKRKWV